MGARLPRAWSAAVEQLARDARMVGRRVAGRGPSPLLKGTPGPAQVKAEARAAGSLARGARANARDLVVARVVRETDDAVTLVLRDPAGKGFDFLPGQFFTLLVPLHGATVPRNYSASNAPGSDELHLTVRVKVGGLVSPRLAATRAGEVLRALGPFGAFVPPPSSTPRVGVLIAGGSGITPLMAIARTLLATEPDAQLALVYANRRRASILFEAALDALRREHPGRLSVRHVLEEAPPGWDGERGRLDRATCARALSALPLAGHPSARYFVCGPDGMRDEVLVALADRGVAPGAVLVERFATGPRPLAAGSGAGLPAALDAASSGGRSVAIRVGERTHQALARPGATLLEAGLAAGVSMPFSCAVGGCGACRVRLVEGQVELDEPNCLSASERGLGYVLACVGRPLGTCVVEVPEVS